MWNFKHVWNNFLSIINLLTYSLTKYTKILFKMLIPLLNVNKKKICIYQPSKNVRNYKKIA